MATQKRNPTGAHVNRTDKGEPLTETSWPRNNVSSVETRKRDLVLRITDWTDDEDEPAFDVEVYVRGIYDWNESKVFCTKSANRSKPEAKRLAIEFAQQQIEKHL